MTTVYPEIINKLKNSFFKDLEISDLTIHKESQEYTACTFRLNGKRIEFRLAKITPKKTGQFVTVWKRSSLGITQPFDESDDLDFMMIACESKTDFGVFIFPKNVLVEKKIISKNEIGGKRGIRVYPTWVITENLQSTKTQLWQKEYFVKTDELNPQSQLLIKGLI